MAIERAREQLGADVHHPLGRVPDVVSQVHRPDGRLHALPEIVGVARGLQPPLAARRLGRLVAAYDPRERLRQREPKSRKTPVEPQHAAKSSSQPAVRSQASTLRESRGARREKK